MGLKMIDRNIIPEIHMPHVKVPIPGLRPKGNVERYAEIVALVESTDESTLAQVTGFPTAGMKIVRESWLGFLAEKYAEGRLLPLGRWEAWGAYSRTCEWRQLRNALLSQYGEPKLVEKKVTKAIPTKRGGRRKAA